MRLTRRTSLIGARECAIGLCAAGLVAIAGCSGDEMQAPRREISAAVAPTGGLVGEWKLDEMGGTTAADTKSGYTATVLGGAAFTGGKLGRALDLNNGTAGTGGKYAQMPSNAVLDNVQEADYTLSAWFWAYSVPTDAVVENRFWAVLVKNGQHMGLVYDSGQHFSMRHYTTGDTLRSANSSTTYVPGGWHHVAGVVSRSGGTIKIYVDGLLKGTTAFAPNTAAREYLASRFRIGRASTYWSANGKVDQVRIYDRALTAAEVSDLATETIAAGGVSNCIGAPSTGADQATYSEKRVFLESQGWWGKNTNGTVPKYGAAEHLHVGMCFPLLDTVSGTTTFRVRVMAHMLPVGSVVQSTSLHDPNDASGTPHHITLASIGWNHTITQAEHDDPDGWVKWDSVTFNTTTLLPDGLRELRNLTTVVRPADAGQPVGAEIHASSGWCWTIANGTGSSEASGSCASSPTLTTARGWYDCFEYKLAETRDWDPYANIPNGTNYTIKISGRDGAGDNTFMSGWQVRLDPDFHHQVLGDSIDGGLGSGVGKIVTIPAAKMTTGVHKLVVIGFANQNCVTPAHQGGGIVPQNGEVSGVFAIPLKVN
jgi:hypothetical protein